MPVSHFTMTLGRQAAIDQRGISTANTTAGWWCLKKKKKKQEARQHLQMPLYGCCPSKATTTFEVLSV